MSISRFERVPDPQPSHLVYLGIQGQRIRVFLFDPLTGEDQVLLPLDETRGSFTWGIRSDGTRALAAAILYDVIGRRALAEVLAPRFVDDVLLHVPPSGFRLRQERVREWVRQQRPGSI